MGKTEILLDRIENECKGSYSDSYRFKEIRVPIRNAINNYFNEHEKKENNMGKPFLERIISEIDLNKIILLCSLFCVFLFFLILFSLSGKNSNSDLYNKCVLSALEKLEKSSDVFSVCKELK